MPKDQIEEGQKNNANRSNRRRTDNTMPKRSNRRRTDNTMSKDQIEEGQTTQCQKIK
jgi:hypothetical protein